MLRPAGLGRDEWEQAGMNSSVSPRSGLGPTCWNQPLPAPAALCQRVVREATYTEMVARARDLELRGYEVSGSATTSSAPSDIRRDLLWERRLGHDGHLTHETYRRPNARATWRGHRGSGPGSASRTSAVTVSIRPNPRFPGSGEESAACGSDDGALNFRHAGKGESALIL